jgi:hypothetical protein
VEVVTLVLRAEAWQEAGVLVLPRGALGLVNPGLCAVLAVVVPSPDQGAASNLAPARDQGRAECQIRAGRTLEGSDHPSCPALAVRHRGDEHL